MSRPHSPHAFCNNDGSVLLVPQEGRLDTQTGVGRLMVRPGELAVMQAGMRFTVEIPDGDQSVRTAWLLPRDFKIPVASFDSDLSKWEIVVKLAGDLFTYEQDHTPYDVVAKFETSAPYKCAMEKCITRNTFRLPYYHRNVATGIMGMPYEKWKLTSLFDPGGLTYEPNIWKDATSADLQNIKISEGSMACMMHISAHVSLASYALERSGKFQPVQDDVWDDFRGAFLDNLNEV
ncbi:RmlC-like cupin [Xylariaceae sp. FL0255]|nr:RmlC-like cupin [Xylariaceae sp. FL0255]